MSNNSIPRVILFTANNISIPQVTLSSHEKYLYSLGDKLIAASNFSRADTFITHGTEILLAEKNITCGNEILLAGMKYYSRQQNITRGNQILLAGMKYYSRE